MYIELYSYSVRDRLWIIYTSTVDYQNPQKRRFCFCLKTRFLQRRPGFMWREENKVLGDGSFGFLWCSVFFFHWFSTVFLRVVAKPTGVQGTTVLFRA